MYVVGNMHNFLTCFLAISRQVPSPLSLEMLVSALPDSYTPYYFANCLDTRAQICSLDQLFASNSAL